MFWPRPRQSCAISEPPVCLHSWLAGPCYASWQRIDSSLLLLLRIWCSSSLGDIACQMCDIKVKYILSTWCGLLKNNFGIKNQLCQAKQQWQQPLMHSSCVGLYLAAVCPLPAAAAAACPCSVLLPSTHCQSPLDYGQDDHYNLIPIGNERGIEQYRRG